MTDSTPDVGEPDTAELRRLLFADGPVAGADIGEWADYAGRRLAVALTAIDALDAARAHRDEWRDTTKAVAEQRDLICEAAEAERDDLRAQLAERDAQVAVIRKAFDECFDPDMAGVDWRDDKAIQTLAAKCYRALGPGAADVLAVKAGAWDEGVARGIRFASGIDPSSPNNPYRGGDQ